MGEVTFIGWLTTGWTSADAIGLAMTLGGLAATYYQARKAKNVAEETRENVTRELGRVKVNLASFNLLEKIHAALSAIDLAKGALTAPDYSRVVGYFEIIAENLTLLSNEDLFCVSTKRDKIEDAISYLNEKIESIGEQMTKPRMTEQPYKVVQVISNIKSMLKLIERDLVKETFDGSER